MEQHFQGSCLDLDLSEKRVTLSILRNIEGFFLTNGFLIEDGKFRDCALICFAYHKAIQIN